MVHPGLILLQILAYLFIPGLILLMTQVVWPDKVDRMESCGVVCGVSFLVCGGLHIVSYMMQRKDIEADTIQE